MLKIVVIVAGIILLAYLFGFFGASILGSNDREFKWHGLDVKAHSSTGFDGQGNGCAQWRALVEPTTDSESGGLTLSSYSNFGQCSGQSASSSVEITIKDPQSLKSVFLETSGYARTGYDGISNCPSSSASASISQEGGASQTLASISASCRGTDSNFPNGILINVDGGYLTIPSIQSTIKLEGNNDLKLNLAIGSNAGNNGRGAQSQLSLSNIDIKRKENLPPPTTNPPPIVEPPITTTPEKNYTILPIDPEPVKKQTWSFLEWLQSLLRKIFGG